MYKNCFALLGTLLLLAIFSPVHAVDFDEGIDYQIIKPAQPTSTSKIEVVEVFWYGCPHCYYFEPAVTKWLKKLPGDVEFVRIPAASNPRWALHARAFYVAEVLDVFDKIHEPLFDAMHRDHQHLHDADALAKFFQKHAGIDKQTFLDTFSSFSVDTRVSRAEQLGQRYGVSSVPTLIINGKYRTSPSMTGSRKNALDVVDHLIAKERSKR